MSQKLGIPYLGVGLSAILFLIFGIVLSTLTYLLEEATVALGITTMGLVIGIVRFLGIWLTGWALLNFMVSKDLLPMQRLIASFFAFLTLVSLFVVTSGYLVLFRFNVA